MRRRGGRARRDGGVGHRVLATALVVALAACTGGGPDVPERAAADAPARTTSTTAPPPPGLERVAAAATVLGGAGESRFTDVAVGARAIVVIGEQDGAAAIWTTYDGAVYDPAVLAGDVFPAGAVLHDLVLTRDGFVVVGSAGGQAAAWASTDGRSWLGADLRGGDVADVVILGELGLTAFGRDGGALAVWTSFDGLAWERVAGGPAVFERAGDARVVGAHDDGEGLLALVDRGGDVELWTSRDGRTWAPAPATGAELLPAGGPPRPATLLGAGSTAVALGSVEDPDGVDAAVWTSVAGDGWERAPHSEAVFGGDGAQVALAAAQLGADLVAVGTDTDETGDVDAVVWSTAPGGGWQRSAPAVGDGTSGPGDQHAVAVAPTRDGALVVGWERDGDGTRAVAWTLAEGAADEEPAATGPVLAWRRVPATPPLGGPGEQQMDDVVAAGGELVAVGSSTRPDAPGGDLDAAVWASADGLAWERVADPDGALGGPGDQRLRAVVAAPGGALVAVGSDGGSAAVWVRFPGDAGWARVPPDEAVFGGPGDQVASSVAARADGSLVAVGADGGTGDAAVWRSTGGRTWERVLPGGDLGGSDAQEMRAVAVVGPVLVAVGSSGGTAVAWTSLDGSTWQRSDLGPGRAEAVAEADGGAVAVGSLGGVERGLDAAAWRSPEGRTWTAVPVDDGPLAVDDQEALAVRRLTLGEGEPVLAAVGRTHLGPGDDAAAWRSEDGSEWSRAPHDEDAYGGDQAQRMVAVAQLGDVAVAVGWTGSTPASRDAAVWVTAPAGAAGGVL